MYLNGIVQKTDVPATPGQVIDLAFTLANCMPKDLAKSEAQLIIGLKTPFIKQNEENFIDYLMRRWIERYLDDWVSFYFAVSSFGLNVEQVAYINYKAVIENFFNRKFSIDISYRELLYNLRIAVTVNYDLKIIIANFQKRFGVKIIFSQECIDYGITVESLRTSSGVLLTDYYGDDRDFVAQAQSVPSMTLSEYLLFIIMHSYCYKKPLESWGSFYCSGTTVRNNELIPGILYVPHEKTIKIDLFPKNIRVNVNKIHRF